MSLVRTPSVAGITPALVELVACAIRGTLAFDSLAIAPAAIVEGRVKGIKDALVLSED